MAPMHSMLLGPVSYHSSKARWHSLNGDETGGRRCRKKLTEQMHKLTNSCKIILIYLFMCCTQCSKILFLIFCVLLQKKPLILIVSFPGNHLIKISIWHLWLYLFLHTGYPVLQHDCSVIVYYPQQHCLFQVLSLGHTKAVHGLCILSMT